MRQKPGKVKKRPRPPGGAPLAMRKTAQDPESKLYRSISEVRELLYDRRYTIAGARRTLLDERKQDEPQVELGFSDAERKLLVAELKEEMRTLLAKLKRPVEATVRG